MRVDGLLDDARFFAPYLEFFHATLGRPSIPIETYLRLMFLKYRYRLGFETLCREVTDSITWQRFCRIPLGGRVPHPTTLMKITTRCGEQAVNGLNEALLARAVEAKVLKTNRVRADTTVVEANVAYPSDSSLLAKGVAKMADDGEEAAGDGAGDTHASGRQDAHGAFRGPGRSTPTCGAATTTSSPRCAGSTVSWPVSPSGSPGRPTPWCAMLAARCTPSVTGPQEGPVPRWTTLERTAALTRRVAAQTRQRLAGTTPAGATRVVSLHDADARPIAKGRLGKPVEFGYKAQLVDNEDGVIVDHNIEAGNPPDAPCSSRRSNASSDEPDERRGR